MIHWLYYSENLRKQYHHWRKHTKPKAYLLKIISRIKVNLIRNLKKKLPSIYKINCFLAIFHSYKRQNWSKYFLTHYFVFTVYIKHNSWTNIFAFSIAFAANNYFWFINQIRQTTKLKKINNLGINNFLFFYSKCRSFTILAKDSDSLGDSP